MQPLYTVSEFNNSKSRQLLPLRCLHCAKTFFREKHRIQDALRPGRAESYDFCSSGCHRRHEDPPVIVSCDQCHKSFNKRPSQTKGSPHNFCCQSCSAKWSNSHKTTGTRISKLERWLQEQLPPLYPSIEFHFNRKDTINGELDIYIPSLKLAFELNGIFHYEPIYGPEKLANMQTNDARKSQACLERGIELCIIDVSHQKYFKEQSSMKFFGIVKNVIDLKLAGCMGVEPISTDRQSVILSDERTA